MIEQVLKSTPDATRVLELSSTDLPSVDDSPVTVSVETKQVQRDAPFFGTRQEGDEAVWEGLTCHADARLKAVDPSAAIDLGQVSSTLASRDDLPVLSLLDKERSRTNLLAKSKHKEHAWNLCQ